MCRISRCQTLLLEKWKLVIIGASNSSTHLHLFQYLYCLIMMFINKQLNATPAVKKISGECYPHSLVILCQVKCALCFLRLLQNGLLGRLDYPKCPKSLPSTWLLQPSYLGRLPAIKVTPAWNGVPKLAWVLVVCTRLLWFEVQCGWHVCLWEYLSSSALYSCSCLGESMLHWHFLATVYVCLSEHAIQWVWAQHPIIIFYDVEQHFHFWL